MPEAPGRRERPPRELGGQPGAGRLADDGDRVAVHDRRLAEVEDEAAEDDAGLDALLAAQREHGVVVPGVRLPRVQQERFLRQVGRDGPPARGEPVVVAHEQALAVGAHGPALQARRVGRAAHEPEIHRAVLHPGDDLRRRAHLRPDGDAGLVARQRLQQTRRGVVARARAVRHHDVADLAAAVGADAAPQLVGGGDQLAGRGRAAASPPPSARSRAWSGGSARSRAPARARGPAGSGPAARRAAARRPG